MKIKELRKELKILLDAFGNVEVTALTKYSVEYNIKNVWVGDDCNFGFIDYIVQLSLEEQE